MKTEIDLRVCGRVYQWKDRFTYFVIIGKDLPDESTVHSQSYFEKREDAHKALSDRIAEIINSGGCLGFRDRNTGLVTDLEKGKVYYPPHADATPTPEQVKAGEEFSKRFTGAGRPDKSDG